jgi:hypothetical protein
MGDTDQKVGEAMLRENAYLETAQRYRLLLVSLRVCLLLYLWDCLVPVEIVDITMLVIKKYPELLGVFFNYSIP